MNEICSHNVQCVCAYQQEEFLRPHPDTLSDLTAMPRANQQVHINMNTHQNIAIIQQQPEKETIWFEENILISSYILLTSYPHTDMVGTEISCVHIGGCQPR